MSIPPKAPSTTTGTQRPPPPADLKVEDETKQPSDSASVRSVPSATPGPSTTPGTSTPRAPGTPKTPGGISRTESQKKVAPLSGLLSKFRNKSTDIEKAEAPNVAERDRRRREGSYDHHVPLIPYVAIDDAPGDVSAPNSFHERRPRHSHDIHATSSTALVHGDQGRRLSAWSVTYSVETHPSTGTTPHHEYSEESIEEESEGVLDSLHYGIRRFFVKHQRPFKIFILSLVVLLFAIYFGFALYMRKREHLIPPKYYFNFCNGVGFLLILTLMVLWFLAYYRVMCPVYTRWINKHVHGFLQDVRECFNDKTVKKILYGMTSLIFVVFLIFDGIDNQSKLRCSGGVVIYVFLGYIFSKHPSHVQWSVVFWGLVLQYTFALLILYWGLGDTIIECISNKVKEFVEVSNEGALLMFSYLVNGTNQTINITYTFTENENNVGEVQTIDIQGVVFIPWVVGFRMVPAVLFFSCVLSILFYYGVLQLFVVKIAWLLQITMGTTAAESINSAANIFLGCTEAPLIIRPFLAHMTKSELHAILTAGFATIAGTMFAVYVAFGLDPKHLMSATFMSAPAALAYAKLLYPETEESITTVKDIKLHKGSNRETNVFAAAANGTINAIPLVATIISTLITFISLLKLVNLIVTWFGSLVGYPTLTLELIMGKVFIPCAYFMGIDGYEHCTRVGELIGLKTIISEFVAYEQLKVYLREGKITKRESVISVYALCGFSNLSAIGMQLGTLGALAPQRMDDMADVVLRALVAGSATCFLTACIAGSLLRDVDDDAL